MRRFGDWLQTTSLLQQQFGVDWDRMRQNDTDLADYITWNLSALFEEVGEMSHELRWHPWKQARGKITTEQRDKALEEAADALHFLANILAALDCSDQEFSDVYAAKQNTNRARLESGRSLATPDGLGRTAPEDLDPADVEKVAAALARTDEIKPEERDQIGRPAELDGPSEARRVDVVTMHYVECPQSSVSEGTGTCTCVDLAHT